MRNGYKEHFEKLKKIHAPKGGTPVSVPSATSPREKKRPRDGGPRKRSRAFPVSAVMYVVLMGFGALFVLLKGENVLEMVDQLEVNWMGAARASEPTGSAPPPAAAKSETTISTASAVGSTSPGDGDPAYLEKMLKRKKELDAREEALTQKENELKEQREAIEARVKELEKIRSEIGEVLKEKVEVDNERVDRLVEFYSNMKPQQAAKVMESLNEDLVVETLGRMKKKNAAEIMNLLDAKKAQSISEKFAGYRRR